MQSQRVNEDEVSTLSQRLVGARGANAAKRAARAVHLAAVSDADLAESEPEQATEMPTARHAEAPANDDVTVAKPAAVPAPRKLPKRALIGLVAALALGAGGWFGYHWFTVGRYIVSTDDAYVHADATTLAAKVSGYVAEIRVDDNAVRPCRRRDRPHRRWRLPACGRHCARQARDPASDGRAHRPANRGAARCGRTSQGATRFGAAVDTRTQSEFKRQQALAAKRFASQQTLEQAQPIAIRRSPACKARRRRSTPPSPMSTYSRRSSRKPPAGRRSSRRRWPRPSAICRSPSSARRSTA